jgi:hypothetical protein
VIGGGLFPCPNQAQLDVCSSMMILGEGVQFKVYTEGMKHSLDERGVNYRNSL